MKKTELYSAPAVRWIDVRTDSSFLTSLQTGTIEPGQEDDWGTLNP